MLSLHIASIDLSFSRDPWGLVVLGIFAVVVLVGRRRRH
jgi:hypothetical protein